MRFAIVTKDKPNHLALRQETRTAHLAYIEETGCVETAGPFLDAEGAMCGSLVIVDCETLAEAQAWAANDPYALAGLFETVSVQAWKRVIG